ncbi:uncharacterized protein LOC120782112 [Bactrocera tryoni]|uniref:uncharacterized protein LOC120782112 n=1 Tax=Bactrocera tryoni TaxID=59916 RepID=UPI001A9563D7|nr:uncharacterized protein LOC120782112 [Bactrocera tryoni]
MSDCYKLFTALKISSDFGRQIQIDTESEQARVNVPELSGESLEISTPSTFIIGAVDTIDNLTIILRAGPSTNPEPYSDDFDDPSDADEQITNEDLLLRECFICNKSWKRRLGRTVPLAVNKIRTIELLKSAATEHSDIEMLEKVSSFADTSTIPYHKCCKDLYLREVNKKAESDFVKKRKASNRAYELLCEMLEEYVVKKNECLFFHHVKKEYQTP